MAKDNAPSLPVDAERRAALFESIIESMGESVLVVDRDGKQVYANKELRRFRGELDPDKNSDAWRTPATMRIFDSDGRELPFEEWPIARALRGEYRDSFEIRVRGMAHRPDETILSISTRSLVGADGGIEGAIVVSRDITAVRQTEEKLRQSQKLETIGQLTGGVAHDFNNMLAAILSSVEVMKKGVAGDARLELAASTIEKAAMRGAELTRHLLAFARKQALAPAPTDVKALVEETLQLLRPALDATIEVAVKAEAGPLYALADASQLTSALLNLCVNARDAMEDGGRLVITVEAARIMEGALKPGDYVRICVSDTGSGMSKETIARAVEPFYTTKGVGKGSGLGLSMAFGFVRQSGGDLVIESVLGQGATVSLLLPRTAAPLRQEAPPDERAGPTGKLRILVVDDDELVRDALSLQLEDSGFEAITAHDGPDALALIEAGLAFDLLLTDLVLPRGINGLALAEAVAALRPNVRAVISSGYAEGQMALPAHARWSILRKPYSADELFAALRTAMFGHG